MVVVVQVLCHYEFMIERSQLMLENQVKKSLSCVVSPHLTRLGEGALHVVYLFLQVAQSLLVLPRGRHLATSPSD